MTIKIGINGFGRIGRLLFRAALKNPEVSVVAINDLTNSETMAHLLKYDSVHGTLSVTVAAKGDGIEVGGKTVAIRSVKDPEKIDWKDLGVDVVAECTGLLYHTRKCSQASGRRCQKSDHFRPGQRSGRYDCHGSELQHLRPETASHCFQCLLHHQLPGAGCKGAARKFRVIGRTDDDDPFLHRRSTDPRFSTQGSSTGASSVALHDSHDNGRCQSGGLGAAGALRKAQWPCHSRPHAQCVHCRSGCNHRKTGVTTRDINDALKNASEGELAGILGFSDLPLVSIDFNGCTKSSIVDAPTTYVVGNLVKVLSWYDNETGYSNRMVDLAAMIGAEL